MEECLKAFFERSRFGSDPAQFVFNSGNLLSPALSSKGGGEGDKKSGRITQGGARSSLALGYGHVTPNGVQYGGDEAANAHGDEIQGVVI